ncbi:hypothetical protein [Lysobacter gummosus]|jgi:hypothetical protein|uniref:hypothetical protein n=1 Tax=Lysobacter gummosus TaxID=262324 RepID=UPI001F20CB8C|nr:hypothetical protein [Lysobacter gummosus]UJQ30023.1 hypothetical protein L2D09_07555 [Lysobacter gummosus]
MMLAPRFGAIGEYIVRKESNKLGMYALAAVVFGFAFSFGASAGDAVPTCERTCEIEYAECMQVVGDDAACGATYRACVRSCDCAVL